MASKKQVRPDMTKRYRYTECGLDNVFIAGIETVIDDADEEVYCVPYIAMLHRLIAKAIIVQKHGMLGKELRFLRTEMGLTQEQLAQLLKVARATMNRWEAGADIDRNAEVVIRLLAAERLDISVDMTVEEAVGWSISKSTSSPIWIDCSDPKQYQLVDKAA